MSCLKNNTSTTNPVVRASATLALTLGALLASSAALAIDSGDILLVSLKGEVYVTMGGVKQAVRAGSVLDPPATLRTGRDGAVELRQGATTLSVGPETLLEFPALEKRGAPIDRIVQPRGNVFYNIGKREGRKLRIETPYLVGVVKGTQFNVAAQDETTTISLFEGLLEVHAADESGVVDLRAGEIASRQREDKGVNVLKMDGAKAPAAPSRQPAGSGSNNSAPQPTPRQVTPHHQDRDSVLVDRSTASADVGVGASVAEVAALRDMAPATVDTGPALPTDLGVDAGAETGSGQVRYTVVVGASNNQHEVTVGSANAADAVANSGHGNGNGNGNQGVDVAVDLGVDLGVDVDTATTPVTDTTDTDKPGHGPPADVVDLLDGLARRRGKK